jgi:hypothetical protein
MEDPEIVLTDPSIAEAANQGALQLEEYQLIR